jgi:hypothetical protein
MLPTTHKRERQRDREREREREREKCCLLVSHSKVTDDGLRHWPGHSSIMHHRTATHACACQRCSGLEHAMKIVAEAPHYAYIE